MPLYEYRCQKCGEHSEKIRRFSDPPLTKCEKCGGKLEQLLSSPAIQFKGSGFYITDYAKKSGSEAGKSSSAPTSTTPENGKTGEAAKNTETTKASETPKTTVTP